MKKLAVLIFIISCSVILKAQTVFFKSHKTFTAENMKNFYSSVSINENIILFNAPDYQLYAYDKKSGRLDWTFDLQRKSDIPPFFVADYIWVNSKEGTLQLNKATGKINRKLDFERVDTRPIVKNSIVYATGIYDAGVLFAYDMTSDSVLWHRFLAHGCSVEPYYLNEKIIANGEGDQWLDVSYNGSIAKGCEIEEGSFPEQMPCIKRFLALTHDQKEIKGKLAKKIEGNEYNQPVFYHTTNHTLAFNDGNLFVIGKSLKLKSQISLQTFSDSLQNVGDGQILKADNELVWLMYNEHLVVFNYIKKKMVNIIDLRKWAPHNPVIDENNLWLISRNDGLLYGLSF